MRHLFFLAILCLCLTMASCGKVTDEALVLPEKVEMYFFYDEICGSCDGTEEIKRIAEEQLAEVRNTYPYQFFMHNVYTDLGRRKFDEVCEELGLQKDSLSFPLLIAGGHVLQGMETIEKSIAEYYLTAGEDIFVKGYCYNPKEKKTGEELFSDYSFPKKSVGIIYFYRIACHECNDTKPVIQELPPEVEVDGKSYPLEILELNTRSGNNNERIAAFFSRYNVPDEDRKVPIVFLSDGYLAGFEEIQTELEGRIKDSARTPFAFPEN